MKLKKNDILELAKSGKTGILAKLKELEGELAKKLGQQKGSSKILKRSIARLLTKLKELA